MSKTVLRALLLLPLLCCCLAGCFPLQSRDSDPLVGAYYYPWYRAPKSAADKKADLGWMKKALRGRLKPPQLPQLGVYDSRKSEVIGEHIAQSLRGNIDFWVVSWWGPDHETDRNFRDHILKHADAKRLKYALFYEPTGRLGSFEKPRYENFVDDFRYMAKRYFDDPRYLRIDDRPVVFVYLTRVYFRGRGQKALAELRRELPELYLVGDEVFGPRYRAEYARQWDAITAYDVYGQSLQKAGATRAALERLERIYRNARTLANSVEVGFVPAISPGFNDRAVRRGHVGRARYFTDDTDSKPGDVFRAMIEKIALPLADPLAERMILVTSFNEWYEDTQIEPTTGTGRVTSEDDSQSARHYTEGQRYADYGELYLDILRQATTGRR